MWDTRELKGKGLSPSKILGWLLKYLTYWKKLQILNHLSLFNNEFSLRSRCQQVEFPLRTLSPSCKWLPFCLSPHSLSFVNPCCLFVCLNILLQKPSLKKISHIDEGPPSGLILMQSPLWRLCLQISHILGYQSLGLQHTNCGEHNSVHNLHFLLMTLVVLGKYVGPSISKQYN